MELQEIIQPDVFTQLSDGDTDASSSNKRVLKSTTKTKDYTDACTRIKSYSKVSNPHH